MEESNINANSNNTFPPRTIIIGNYYYTYKDRNNSGFSYRGKYKAKCNLTINIDIENLNKIINNTGEAINFIISSKKYLAHTYKTESESIKKRKSIS